MDCILIEWHIVNFFRCQNILIKENYVIGWIWRVVFICHRSHAMCFIITMLCTMLYYISWTADVLESIFIDGYRNWNPCTFNLYISFCVSITFKAKYIFLTNEVCSLCSCFSFITCILYHNACILTILIFFFF